jgi:transcriptional regulator with XRE-family HTH domain
VTPFGRHLRRLRHERAMTLKDMAAAVGVSSAYLSALEHGKRGRPSWALVQRLIAHLNVIWDDAEELTRLARLSHPRVTIDTAALSPRATELANRLALSISRLRERELDSLLEVLEASPDKPPLKE